MKQTTPRFIRKQRQTTPSEQQEAKNGAIQSVVNHQRQTTQQFNVSMPQQQRRSTHEDSAAIPSQMSIQGDPVHQRPIQSYLVPQNHHRASHHTETPIMQSQIDILSNHRHPHGIATMAVSPSPQSLQSMSISKEGAPDSYNKAGFDNLISLATYEEQKAAMLKMLKHEVILKTAVGQADLAKAATNQHQHGEPPVVNTENNSNV